MRGLWRLWAGPSAAAGLMLLGAAAPCRAQEAGCSRDWKAFAEALAGDARAPEEKLAELSTAWIEESVCAQKKVHLGAACQEAAVHAQAGEEPPKAVRKQLGRGCDALEGSLDRASDALVPAIEAAREKESSAAEGGRSGPAADLADGWWSQAATAEGFGKGLERLVHYFHRSAGASLDAAVKDFETTRRAISKLRQDLEDAYQLGLTKDEQKAKKQEVKALEKDLRAKEKAVAVERKKFRKETASKLDRWAKSVRKEFKAKLKAKDLCACSQPQAAPPPQAEPEPRAEPLPQAEPHPQAEPEPQAEPQPQEPPAGP